MRGTRVKKLRKQFRQEHRRQPGLSGWSDLGREELIPTVRRRSVISRFVGKIPFFRAIWSPAKKADDGKKTKLRWFLTRNIEPVLKSRSEWRQVKQVWKEGRR